MLSGMKLQNCLVNVKKEYLTCNSKIHLNIFLSTYNYLDNKQIAIIFAEMYIFEKLHNKGQETNNTT